MFWDEVEFGGDATELGGGHAEVAVDVKSEGLILTDAATI